MLALVMNGCEARTRARMTGEGRVGSTYFSMEVAKLVTQPFCIESQHFVSRSCRPKGKFHGRVVGRHRLRPTRGIKTATSQAGHDAGGEQYVRGPRECP